MRRAISAVSALAVVALLPVAAPALAEPDGPTAIRDAPLLGGDDLPTAAVRSHDRSHPLEVERRALRRSAVDQLATGRADLRGRGPNRVIELRDGTEVDYPATETAQLLTFLVEFGDDPTGVANPDFPVAGPLRNEIPKPSRADNATYWKSDFDRAHYDDMFFDGLADQGGESMADLYDEMSSGRFDLQGDVSEWIRVDHPESYYSDADGFENQPEMTAFIRDSADAWYDAQRAAGGSPERIGDYLARFDVWDRYDADGDGDHTEPDGYIDHFQAIHAGVGEEAYGPAWSIWSHRWAANIAGYGVDGPTPRADCSACGPQGGVEIGDTGYWIFDYTTEPENGGLGVFAHEFGHDLGLPDYYDSQSEDPDNGTGFWNLMSSGSWLGHGRGDVGTTPNQMGATEKLFLGWYGADDLVTVDGLAARPREVVLGPSYHATTTGAQAVLVDLPDGTRTLDGSMPDSSDGAYLQTAGADGLLATARGPAVTVPSGDATLTARVAHEIEPGFDYAYLQVSTDGGETWEFVPTSLSTDEDPHGQNLGHGITGVSDGWVDLTADLSPWAGSGVDLRWLYLTDGRTHGWGLAVDDLAVGGYRTTFTTADDWQLSDVYAVSGGTYDVSYPQYYVAENRQYRGYDRTLATGPYAATDPADPNRVDHFDYQDGLLVWYHNGFYSDNDTSVHPGGGVDLPVDATPQNQVWRSRRGAPVALAEGRLQTFDSTFDVDRRTGLRLSTDANGGMRLLVAGGRSVPVFEDHDRSAYLDDSGGPAGLALSTEVAGVGTQIQVVSSDERAGRMVVRIGKRFVAATSRPRLLGGDDAGDLLVALPPAWFQRGVSTTVTWLRDGRPISGARGLLHRLTRADAGHTVSASFTGSKQGYTATDAITDGVAVSRGRGRR
ncbi:immune inhibitor A domain-containing protein [Nocardioides sp. YIM 152315]|uniref:immune inhibitor A domain-containing protein n=1 Tax=Nocardioides sp. YIM 152315 TaxID=3031760 RepID=UPI0023DA0CBC|nr:immune inhibitor A domain-containing protein [Nocardioides sp. YIM 152315]MDF1605733.1 immune inhibitor A [Nocardioides sp. YIM 152315]